jgi:hypothetical protein
MPGAYLTTAPGAGDFTLSKLRCSKVLLPPTIPINLSGKMEADRVILNWELPEFDGFSAIKGYNISRGLVKHTETEFATTKDLNFTDGEIDITQTYYYYVTAFNRIGTSPTSRRIKVEEKVPPTIHEDLTPSEIIPGMQLNFKAWVTDNAVIDDVRLIYWIDDGDVNNISLYNYGKDDNWTYFMELPDREFQLNYYFFAVDSKKNKAVTELNVKDVTGQYLPAFLEDDTPRSVGALKDLNFSVKVQDNWDVDKVCVEYWINEGFHWNRTMDEGELDKFVFRIVATGMPGDTITYRFSAVDIDGNWNETEPIVVQIIDDSLPYLIQDHTSSQCTTGESFTFKLEAADDIEMESVTLEYRFGDGPENSMIMNNPFGMMYTHTIEVPHTLSELHYRIIFTDIHENSGQSMEKNVSVVDNDPPNIISDDSDTSAATGGSFHFKVRVDDNIGIKEVWVKKWFDGGSGTSVQMTQEDDGPFKGDLEIPDEVIGKLNYIIQVKDLYGNQVSGPLVRVAIEDGLAPQIEPIEDMTTYVGWEINIDIHVIDNIRMSHVIWMGLPELCTDLTWTGYFENTGIHTIRIKAVDISGNEAFTEFSITILGEDHDTDGDGIPDLIEMTLGLSHLDPEDASYDLDEDGLNNIYEFGRGTYLERNDSDNDGMDDGWEEMYGLNPLFSSSYNDEDDDGMSDLEEYLAGTDPTVPQIVETKEEKTSFGPVNTVLVILIIAGIIILFFLLVKKKQ